MERKRISSPSPRTIPALFWLAFLALPIACTRAGAADGREWVYLGVTGRRITLQRVAVNRKAMHKGRSNPA